MHLSRRLWPILLAGMMLCLMTVAPSAAQSVPDFTFIHMSDSHSPHGSGPTIAEMVDIGPIQLLPYGMFSEKPSFIIDTGDMMEFGPYEGALDTYLSWFKDIKMPVYHQSGNHDGTWYCIRRALRRWHGSHHYSFDKFGCHFVGLDSSSPQDPRPSLTREQLLWLEQDLKKIKPDTPLFVFMHHALGNREFASSYEQEMLVDLLRPYNLVYILVGHSHAYKAGRAMGIDQVPGGSPFHPNHPGFSVVTVKDNKLTVAYKKRGEAAATEAVLQKPIFKGSAYPKITIASPERGKSYQAASVPIRATITGNKTSITSAAFSLDGAEPRELRFDRPNFGATLDTALIAPGAHYLKVEFTDSQGATYQRSTHFYVDNEDRVLWRVMADGSFKATPAVTADTVYAGATDGRLYAFDRKDGRRKWTYKSGGEILCEPLVSGNTVYFGSGDAKFYAVGTDGKFKWSYQAVGPCYSSPVMAGGLVIFGSNDSRVYALNAETGKQVWVNNDPLYTMESQLFLDGDTVYLGSWDTYAYAIDAKTGKLKWKTVGYGSANQPAARYYSPADAGPVVVGGKVYIADRNFTLSIIDAESGEMTGNMDKCSATGISEDGKFVYLRRTDGHITKLNEAGEVIWNVPAVGDIIPTAPTEKDGVVLAASRSGNVKAVSADSGKVMWEYQATPGMFIMSAIPSRDGIAYVTGMDGSLTALKIKTAVE